jgi:hypothetical protein
MKTERIELAVAGLSASESSPGNYALILEDIQSRRRFPVIIGAAEAQSIAVCVEQMRPPRPLAHDLYVQSMEALGVKIQEMVIRSVSDGIFYALLILRTADGRRIEADARTSDAIAIALRCGAPMYTYPEVAEEAGFLAEVFSGRQKKGSISAYTIEEMEEILQKLLDKEDYESAARVRAMIGRRQAGDAER